MAKYEELEHSYREFNRGFRIGYDEAMRDRYVDDGFDDSSRVKLSKGIVDESRRLQKENDEGAVQLLLLVVFVASIGVIMGAWIQSLVDHPGACVLVPTGIATTTVNFN